VYPVYPKLPFNCDFRTSLSLPKRSFPPPLIEMEYGHDWLAQTGALQLFICCSPPQEAGIFSITRSFITGIPAHA